MFKQGCQKLYSQVSQVFQDQIRSKIRDRDPRLRSETEFRDPSVKMGVVQMGLVQLGLVQMGLVTLSDFQ